MKDNLRQKGKNDLGDKKTSTDSLQTESNDPGTNEPRRSFLKKAAMGGISLAALPHLSVEDTVSHLTSNIQRNSNPSELKITDMRIAEVTGVMFRTPIIRLYTNQGIVGHGDVRDGAAREYALMLKHLLLGENPTHIERLFKKIRQFGFHARQGGGVSGVEMALCDLAGKAYGVPVHMMLGGKYRDKVRLYSDTTTSRDPQEFARRLKARADQGYSVLKMDVGIGLLRDMPGTVVNPEWASFNPWRFDHRQTSMIAHPFKHIQITDKGVDRLMEYIAAAREAVGWEIPIGVDHWGHVGVEECIRLNRAAEPYRLAYSEDSIPWHFFDDWKRITESSTTPTLTGEDIYCLEGGFKEIIDKRTVNIIHPDPNTAGGCFETKRIGDYAGRHGIGFMHHHAAGPVSFLGCVHSAAATENFFCLEHHAVDSPEWEDLVSGISKPLVENGYVTVPDTPGLGVELNDELLKKYLVPGTTLFGPTEEWNQIRSGHRLWS
jgi:L-alanine-DL-glutamate epimerase-like enolase superfamily enzyme